jgi:hypothetical protein
MQVMMLLSKKVRNDTLAEQAYSSPYLLGKNWRAKEHQTADN